MEHSKGTRNIPAKYADADEADNEALGAVGEATRALWGFLDDLHREYVGVPAGGRSASG